MSLPDFVSFSEAGLLEAVLRRDRHPNMMIRCGGPSFNPVLLHLRAATRRPLHVCELPGPLDLRGCDSGTVLLHDVAALTVAQQIALYDWMERVGRDVQIISLTRTSIVSEVHEGHFLEGLFYRLNTLSLATTDVVRL